MSDLLNLVAKVILVIVGIWLITYFYTISTPLETPHVKGNYFRYSEHRNAWDVSHYDYSTGTIQYREYGTPPAVSYHPSQGVMDLILDINLEVEDLIEHQLD